MSCITKQHVGKYTYLYESTSFRNAEGKPRNKKVRIGKIDPKTGNTIYTPEYLERMEAAGTPVAVEDNSDTDVDIALMWTSQTFWIPASAMAATVCSRNWPTA